MKAALDDFAAETGDHVIDRGHRAAGGKQIIGNQDTLAGLDGIRMDLEGIGAVFEIIGLAEGFERKFPRFTHQDDAGTELVGQRRADDKAAGFDADDLVECSCRCNDAQSDRSSGERHEGQQGAW